MSRRRAAEKRTILPDHKYKDLETELIPKLIELGLLAKKKNIQLCIDAEEDKRFILSLKIFKKLIEAKELSNWNGLGLALQAYQKRAFYTICLLYTSPSPRD